MRIIIEDFILEPEGIVFNLYRKAIQHKINKDTRERTGETEEIEVNHGYGMSLKSCVRKITAIRLAEGKEDLNLGQYVKAFAAEVDRLEKLLTI